LLICHNFRVRGGYYLRNLWILWFGVEIFMVYLYSSEAYNYQRKYENDIILCPQHECKQNSHCMQFLNIEDGYKIIFLVKSHHHQFFWNGQFLVFLKKKFLFFTNWNVKVPIFMRFCTFLVLLFRELFYAFPS